MDIDNNSNKKGSDLLCLNVNGQITHILRRTLTAIEGSMLASRFSGRWDDSLEKDQDGNFYIDQRPHLFLKLLDFLRDMSNETPGTSYARPSMFDTEDDNNDFFRMVGYYGMIPSVYLIQCFQLDSKDGCVLKNPYAKHKGYSSITHRLFAFLPFDPTSMNIESIEVTLSKTVVICCNWVKTDHVVAAVDDIPLNTLATIWSVKVSVNGSTGNVGLSWQVLTTGETKKKTWKRSNFCQDVEVFRISFHNDGVYFCGEPVLHFTTTTACFAAYSPCLSVQGSFTLTKLDVIPLLAKRGNTEEEDNSNRSMDPLLVRLLQRYNFEKA